MAIATVVVAVVVTGEIVAIAAAALVAAALVAAALVIDSKFKEKALFCLEDENTHPKSVVSLAALMSGEHNAQWLSPIIKTNVERATSQDQDRSSALAWQSFDTLRRATWRVPIT